MPWPHLAASVRAHHKCRQSLFEQTDALTGGWLSRAAALLADCSASLAAAAGAPGRPVLHQAVTSGQLVPTLGKLLLFRLDAFFRPEDVFSSRGVGKATCFARIEERFGPNAAYVAIGDVSR